jgi:hypothetical protein
MLLAGCFEFTAESFHGTNQTVPLLLQPLEHHGIHDHLGSSIDHFLMGSGELLGQFFTLSCLFGMAVLAMIHEGL